jgi:hypothetical protein
MISQLPKWLYELSKNNNNLQKWLQYFHYIHRVESEIKFGKIKWILGYWSLKSGEEKGGMYTSKCLEFNFQRNGLRKNTYEECQSQVYANVLPKHTKNAIFCPRVIKTTFHWTGRLNGWSWPNINYEPPLTSESEANLKTATIKNKRVKKPLNVIGTRESYG